MLCVGVRKVWGLTREKDELDLKKTGDKRMSQRFLVEVVEESKGSLIGSLVLFLVLFVVGLAIHGAVATPTYHAPDYTPSPGEILGSP